MNLKGAETHGVSSASQSKSLTFRSCAEMEYARQPVPAVVVPGLHPCLVVTARLQLLQLEAHPVSRPGLVAEPVVVVVSAVDVVVIGQHLRNHDVLPLLAAEVSGPAAGRVRVAVPAVTTGGTGAVRVDVVVELLVVRVHQVTLGLHPVEQAVLPDGGIALDGPRDVVLVTVAAQGWLFGGMGRGKTENLLIIKNSRAIMPGLGHVRWLD